MTESIINPNTGWVVLTPSIKAWMRENAPRYGTMRNEDFWQRARAYGDAEEARDSRVCSHCVVHRLDEVFERYVAIFHTPRP